MSFTAAYFKRHGFGPDGTGAIYGIRFQPRLGRPRFNRHRLAAVRDLNAIFGTNTAGPNLHDTIDEGLDGLVDDYDTDNGNLGWDAVGKTSLGGMATTPDGQFIFVMNLFDRQLYRIPTSGVIDNATVQRVSIPLTNPDAGVIASLSFTANDLRPFAVEYYRGKIYVGVVYSAETSQNRNELLAAVYTVDPATMAFSPTPVLTVPLNYTRSQSSIGNLEPGVNSDWQPWSSTYFSRAVNPALGEAPQPMLSGLSFDADGNLVLGIRDRGADQMAISIWSARNNTRRGISGDIRRLRQYAERLTNGAENNARGQEPGELTA